MDPAVFVHGDTAWLGFRGLYARPNWVKVLREK